jgi:hypothetical protein
MLNNIKAIALPFNDIAAVGNDYLLNVPLERCNRAYELSFEGWPQVGPLS